MNSTVHANKSPARPARISGIIISLAFFLFCGCPKIAQAQTPVTLGPAPITTFLSNTGAPLAAGKVFTYQAGTNNSQATYSDSTGLVQNANPVILDSAGRAQIWFSALAYKIVVQNSASVQQYSVDNFQVSPFLNGNNSWTGNETHSGTEVFNGAATFSAGGTLSGSFTGSPLFSGNPTFSGHPIFSNAQSFLNGVLTDSIIGITQNNGAIGISGLSALGAAHGEDVVINPGSGGPTGIGGNFNVNTGFGGATSGNAGNFNLTGGNGQGGNAFGGIFFLQGGNSSGVSQGGSFSFTGGTGGSTAGLGGGVTLQGGTGGAGGNGGNISILPGSGGAGGLIGSLIFGGGRMLTTNPTTPSCAVTGAGAGATCGIYPRSTDSDGMVNIVAAAAAAALGTVVLTFSKPMGLEAVCGWDPSQASGTGVWNARATAMTAAPIASATATMNWDNNAVALTNANQYEITYHCVGRQ